MNDYSLELQEQMMNQLEEMQTKIESYKQKLSESNTQCLEATEQAEQYRLKMNEAQEELKQLRENVSLNKKKTNSLISDIRERNKQLEKDNKRLSRQIGVKAACLCSVLIGVILVCGTCNSKTMKEKEALQRTVEEANTADWYLCNNRVPVYDAEYQQMAKYVMDGRAVQVKDIGDEWVEIKSQGLIGYIKRDDFDDFFSEISLNIK